MPRTYHVKSSVPSFDKTLEEAGFSDAVITRQSAEIDSAKLIIDKLCDAPSLIDYASAVSIYYLDAPDSPPVTIFSGRCQTTPRHGAAAAEDHAYTILGPWFQLTKIVYQQDWKMRLDSDPPALRKHSRVILGRNAEGYVITTGEQIFDILSYAISTYSIPLQLPDSEYSPGLGWPDIYLPMEERKDATCADLIQQLLAWTPAFAPAIDYSTAPHPTFRIFERAAAGTPVRSIPIDDPRLTDLAIAPAHDRTVPGVTIRYETTNTVDGVEYMAVEEDIAADPHQFDSLFLTVQLAGSKTRTQKHTIRTIDWPDPWMDKTWWRNRLPALQQFPEDAIAIADVATEYDPEGLEDGLDLVRLRAAFPNFLVGGSIPPWLADTVATAEIRLTALITITLEDEADPPNVLTKLDYPVSFPAVATDAETLPVEILDEEGESLDPREYREFKEKTYSRSDTLLEAEAPPSGLAAALYAQWSTLHYEGSLSLVAADPPDANPADNLDIIADLPEWASMHAIIQVVEQSLADGTTTIQFGPPDHISLADAVELYRLNAKRRAGDDYDLKDSGETSDGYNSIDAGGESPSHSPADSAPGTYQRLRFAHQGDYLRAITLDPTLIPDERDTDIQPRSLLIIEEDDEGGYQIVERIVLAGEAFGTPAAIALLPSPPSSPSILAWSEADGIHWLSPDPAHPYHVAQLNADADAVVFDFVRFPGETP